MWFQLQNIPRKKRKHNIKKFKNAVNYDVLKNPNVSYCEDNNELHYNLDPRLIVKYLVNDDSEPTLLYGYYAEEGDEDAWLIGNDLFDKIEIDNVEVSILDLDTAEGKYQLSSGKHIVKYTLKDPSIIDYAAFNDCVNLTSIIIPSSINTIYNGAFQGCTSLTSITSLATTAPTIEYATFWKVKTGGTLIVPTGSTGYDVWMGTGNYYLGKYSWTKVEQ